MRGRSRASGARVAVVAHTDPPYGRHAMGFAHGVPQVLRHGRNPHEKHHAHRRV